MSRQLVDVNAGDHVSMGSGEEAKPKRWQFRLSKLFFAQCVAAIVVGIAMLIGKPALVLATLFYEGVVYPLLPYWDFIAVLLIIAAGIGSLVNRSVLSISKAYDNFLGDKDD